MFAFSYETSKRMILEKDFKQSILKLKGKKLGCFCKRCKSDSISFATDITECHGEFYANYLNSLEGLT